MLVDGLKGQLVDRREEGNPKSIVVPHLAEGTC